jgi:hypothetical protein
VGSKSGLMPLGWRHDGRRTSERKPSEPLTGHGMVRGKRRSGKVRQTNLCSIPESNANANSKNDLMSDLFWQLWTLRKIA